MKELVDGYWPTPAQNNATNPIKPGRNLHLVSKRRDFYSSRQKLCWFTVMCSTVVLIFPAPQQSVGPYGTIILHSAFSRIQKLHYLSHVIAKDTVHTKIFLTNPVKVKGQVKFILKHSGLASSQQALLPTPPQGCEIGLAWIVLVWSGLVWAEVKLVLGWNWVQTSRKEKT